MVTEAGGSGFDGVARVSPIAQPGCCRGEDSVCGSLRHGSTLGSTGSKTLFGLSVENKVLLGFGPGV